MADNDKLKIFKPEHAGLGFLIYYMIFMDHIKMMAWRRTIKMRMALLKDIYKRSKGWPVGIPAFDAKLAKQLVEEGYLEYAPPAYLYPNLPATYRLTSLGKLVADGKIKL